MKEHCFCKKRYVIFIVSIIFMFISKKNNIMKGFYSFRHKFQKTKLIYRLITHAMKKCEALFEVGYGAQNDSDI